MTPAAPSVTRPKAAMKGAALLAVGLRARDASREPNASDERESAMARGSRGGRGCERSGVLFTAVIASGAGAGAGAVRGGGHALEATVGAPT